MAGGVHKFDCVDTLVEKKEEKRPWTSSFSTVAINRRCREVIEICKYPAGVAESRSIISVCAWILRRSDEFVNGKLTGNLFVREEAGL